MDPLFHFDHVNKRLLLPESLLGHWRNGSTKAQRLPGTQMEERSAPSWVRMHWVLLPWAVCPGQLGKHLTLRSVHFASVLPCLTGTILISLIETTKVVPTLVHLSIGLSRSGTSLKNIVRKCTCINITTYGEFGYICLIHVECTVDCHFFSFVFKQN